MAFEKTKLMMGKWEESAYARLKAVKAMSEETAIRDCLRCEKSFASFGRFHRVCRDCHATPSYRGASQILDFCS